MARSTCTQHVVGDTLTVPISGGSRTYTLPKRRLRSPSWFNPDEPFLHRLAKSRFDMGPNHLSDHDHVFGKDYQDGVD